MATVLPIIADIKGAPLNIYGRLVDIDATYVSIGDKD